MVAIAQLAEREVVIVARWLGFWLKWLGIWWDVVWCGG